MSNASNGAVSISNIIHATRGIRTYDGREIGIATSNAGATQSRYRDVNHASEQKSCRNVLNIYGNGTRSEAINRQLEIARGEAKQRENARYLSFSFKS